MRVEVAIDQAGATSSRSQRGACCSREPVGHRDLPARRAPLTKASIMSMLHSFWTTSLLRRAWPHTRRPKC